MGNGLAKIRADRGWTQERMAEELGMSAGGYRKIEYSTRRLKVEQAKAFASRLGVPLDDILGPDREIAARDADVGFHDGWRPQNAQGIAQLDARAGAGDGSVGRIVRIDTGGIASGHLVTDEWVIPRQALGVAPSQVFAIPVDGTSMEPGLKSEDIVFVDRTTTVIKSDEVHLIDDGSGPMVKRIRLEKEYDPPRLWIMSDNPTVEPYWRPAESIRVIGRVIGKFVRM